MVGWRFLGDGSGDRVEIGNTACPGHRGAVAWAITRGLIFPGSLLTVVSGLFLTFKLMHGPAMGNGWLVTMQGLGILVALLALRSAGA